MEQHLKINSQQKYRLNFKPILFLIWVTGIFGTAVWAEEPSLKLFNSYNLLKKKAASINSANQTNGWSYIISGGVTLGLSIPAYYLSNDVFAKVIYTIGETLGIAAVGYGSYLVLIENDYTRFERIIKGVPQLSSEEKDLLAERFLIENAERAKNVRKIRVITHSLAAGLNILDGLTSSDQNLKTAQFFLGGINTLAALSFGFSKSEEETLADSMNEQNKKATVNFIVGPMVGMRITF